MSRLEERHQTTKEPLLISNFRFKLNAENSEQIIYTNHSQNNLIVNKKNTKDDLEHSSLRNKKSKVDF